MVKLLQSKPTKCTLFFIATAISEARNKYGSSGVFKLYCNCKEVCAFVGLYCNNDMLYNFQVVHPRCVCQIIQYVFIVSTTLYINP